MNYDEKETDTVGAIDYTSGESEQDGNQVEFSMLQKSERKQHVRELWRKVYLKAVGAHKIRSIFFKMHERVINYGTTKNINKLGSDLEKKIIESKSKIVLLPDHPFKRFWNILMIFLLGYVATYVPFNICFSSTEKKEEMSFGELLDIFVDSLFFLDIIINFISAYDDPKTNLPVINLKKIAVNYMTSWFFIDLLAVFPV